MTEMKLLEGKREAEEKIWLRGHPRSGFLFCVRENKRMKADSVLVQRAEKPATHEALCGRL